MIVKVSFRVGLCVFGQSENCGERDEFFCPDRDSFGNDISGNQTKYYLTYLK